MFEFGSDHPMADARCASPDHPADTLLAYLDDASERGYIGEPISQLEHALQCADAAQRAGAEQEVVLAALFHDLGHLLAQDAEQMGGYGVVAHESVGAQRLLDAGCSARMANLVRRHVDAKRYLCATRPAYAARLSDASRQTLQWQGGPMSPAEVDEFERLPDRRAVLALRTWDEVAKDPDASPPPLSTYREALRLHIDQQGSQAST